MSKIIVAQIITFLIMPAVLGGCIVLPRDLPDKRPFGDDELAFIEAGVTNKSMVVDELGSPYRTYSDGSWWIYSASQDLTDWVLLDLLFWDPDWGPPHELAKLDRGSRRFHLLLHFSHDDTVREIAIVNEKDPCNRDRTICLDSDNLVLSSLSDDGLSVSTKRLIYTPQLPLIEIEVDHSGDFDLVRRNGLVYERGGEEPFTGTVTTLHDDGWVEQTVHYENGMLNGTKTIWNENGKKRYDAAYVDGRRHGLVTFWDTNGLNPKAKCYQNGRLARMNKCRQ